jgi:hypothetical protein
LEFGKILRYLPSGKHNLDIFIWKYDQPTIIILQRQSWEEMPNHWAQNSNYKIL